MTTKRKIWLRIALAQLVVLLVIIFVWVLANRLPRVQHYNRLLEPDGARTQLETDIPVEPMPEPNNHALEADLGYARFRWPYEPFTEIRWDQRSTTFVYPGQRLLTLYRPYAYGYQVEGGPARKREMEQAARRRASGHADRGLDLDDLSKTLAEAGEAAYEIEQALALRRFIPEQLDHPYAWRKAILAAKPTSSAKVLLMECSQAHRYLIWLEYKRDLLSECTDLCLLEGPGVKGLCRQRGSVPASQCTLNIWDSDRRLGVLLSLQTPKTAQPSLEPLKQLAGSFRFTIDSLPEDSQQLTQLMLQTLVRQPELIAETDSLCQVASHLSVDLFRQVAAHCPDLNAVGPDQKQTPLHAAVSCGRLEIVTALLDAGVDVNVSTPQGQNPLHWAALRDDPNVAECILARGADPNMADVCGFTPLAQATGAIAPLLAPPGVQLLDQSSMPITKQVAQRTAREFVESLGWWQAFLRSPHQDWLVSVRFHRLQGYYAVLYTRQPDSYRNTRLPPKPDSFWVEVDAQTGQTKMHIIEQADR